MDPYREARQARDEDFDKLMEACNMAKDAVKTGGVVYTPANVLKLDDEDDVNIPLSKLEIEAVPPHSYQVDPSSHHHVPTVSALTSPIPRIQVDSTKSSKSESTPKALDNLDSSVESDPVTVVEKDDNGFVYYKCRFCGLTFNYMNTLRAHERVHNVSQPYVCGKCGESFEFSCQLEYHTAQHSDVKGYKCECGRTFYSYTEMLYHKHPEDVQNDKEESVLHGAPLLVSPSTSRWPLNEVSLPTPDYAEKGFEPKHPLKVYSDIRSKPYICEYCSKSYSDSRQLCYHMYSHRGEKMFNPRSSRYLMGRTGVGYFDRDSYAMFPRTSGYVHPSLL